MNDERRENEETRVERIRRILATYGEDFAAATWSVHGKTCIYHAALERISTKAEIVFDMPVMVRAEADEAVMVVSGLMNGRRMWSIGEAKVEHDGNKGVRGNYKIKPKQSPYVYAMAEKRGKDRVILKFLDLHGELYSEDEADDFKTEIDSDRLQQEFITQLDAIGDNHNAIESFMKNVKTQDVLAKMAVGMRKELTDLARDKFTLAKRMANVRSGTQAARQGPQNGQGQASRPAATQVAQRRESLPQDASDRRGGGFGSPEGNTREDKTPDEILADFKDQLTYCKTTDEVEAMCDEYRAAIEAFTPPDQKIANAIRREALERVKKANA